jgi:hypothetical protein
LKGSWIESSLNNYQNDGTIANIQNLLNGALTFKAARNVNIFCGEYGAYNINSNSTDRVAWYAATQSYLTSKNIPWTSWDYQDGFGLFNKGSNELFDYDLNTPLLSAMGLNIPPQQVYVPKPESASFPVYQEYIEANCFQASSENGGSIDFYNQDQPKTGKYCIKWTGSNQYGNLGFNFKPTKDLSVLVKNDFAVSFWLKCDQAATKFDVRFVDTKTGASDHPWRMNCTVDQTVVPMDGAWHFVYLPLKNFVEGGSYDNNTFIPQAGLFDWTAIDFLQFVNEYSKLDNTNIWIDNIVVTNNKLLDVPALNADEANANIYFDATNQSLTIRCNLKDACYQVVDLFGKVVHTAVVTNERTVVNASNWSKGGYVAKLKAGKHVFVTKFIIK